MDSTLAAIQRPGADSFSCADDQVEAGGEFSNSTSRFIAFGRDRLGNLRWAFGSGGPYFYRASPLRPAFVERPRTPECRGEAVFLQEGRRPNAGYSPPCESMTRGVGLQAGEASHFIEVRPLFLWTAHGSASGGQCAAPMEDFDEQYCPLAVLAA